MDLDPPTANFIARSALAPPSAAAGDVVELQERSLVCMVLAAGIRILGEVAAAAGRAQSVEVGRMMAGDLGAPVAVAALASGLGKLGGTVVAVAEVVVEAAAVEHRVAAVVEVEAGIE